MESRKVNLYLESNPNPNSLKFVADYMLVAPGTNFDFPDAASTVSAPLAAELFKYNYVRRVFYMSNFITITKSEDMEWLEVKDELKNHIQSFLESGKEILLPKATASDEQDTEIDLKIKSLLEEYIRPAVEQDGGAIEYKSFENGIVSVYLQGDRKSVV